MGKTFFLNRGLILAVCMAACITTSGCIGNFKVTKSVLDWNSSYHENKWVQEVTFVVILPAYGLTTFWDAIVSNSMDFWEDGSAAGDVPMVDK